MGLFDNFPYTNFHELNLDWILKILKEIQTTIEQFVDINSLKYADPIQWDITTQYETNTIVIEPVSGTAYISVQAVPSGVDISNTDYWTPVFDLSYFITRAGQNFANTFEATTTTTATMATPEGGWIVWDSLLYEAMTNISIGDAYIVGGNIELRTVEYFFNILKGLIASEAQTRYDEDTRIELDLTDLITSRVGIEAQTRYDEDTRIELDLTNLINSQVAIVQNEIGDLNNLNTTDKSSVVAAINEHDAEIGDLNNLTTTDKSSLVSAINEVNYKIDNIKSGIYYNVLDYGAVGDGVADDTQAFIDAITAASATKGVVFVPDTSDYYKLTSTIELRGDTYIVGENLAEIRSIASDAFTISGINGCLENLLIRGNNSNNAVFIDLDTQILFRWRFNHLHIRNCVHAFYDNVTGVNYIVDCIFNDINCDYTYGVQFLSNRSRGFITLRNFKVDNTENRRDITWSSIVIYDVIGLEMEEVDVVGPVSRDSYTVSSFANVWGIYIKGAGSGTSSIWLTRVLVDTAPINGIIIDSINYINGNYIEAFGIVGSALSISNCTLANITNILLRGGVGVAYAPAGANGLGLSGNGRINISNILSTNNTGSGVTMVNCEDCMLSNVQSFSNTNYGYYEAGTSNKNVLSGGSIANNGISQVIQSGSDSALSNIVISGTIHVSETGSFSV